MVTSTSTPGSKLMLVWKKGKFVMEHNKREYTDDLFDDLAGRVQIDQPLVDLQLIAIPGF